MSEREREREREQNESAVLIDYLVTRTCLISRAVEANHHESDLRNTRVTTLDVACMATLGTRLCWCKVSKPWCLTSTETIRLIRDGEKVGKGTWRWEKREIIYLSVHCHHQNDFCIKIGGDESHF